MGRRERSADIAEVGALIFQPPAAAASDTPTGRAGGALGRAPAHPATAERTERRTRRDVFDLDPRRVVERGPYIREWDESGEAFERLAAAVAARGEVDTPIWVRSEGPTGQRIFTLVAGKGRLRAALRNKLPSVPVRDLGELAEPEAVARQVEENLNRADMTPAETAHALWLLRGYGESVSAIGRRLHRDKGYVSYMARVGEAVDALPAQERAAVGRHGVLQIRDCQRIGAIPDVAARTRALRAAIGAARAAAHPPDAPTDGEEGIAVGAQPARRRPDETQPFYGRASRGGRAFRMRWGEPELRADPVALARGFVEAVRREGAELANALRRLEGEGGAGDRRRDVARALRAIEPLLRDG